MHAFSTASFTSLALRLRFDFGTSDGYGFFMELGPLKNANHKYLKNRIAYWNTRHEYMSFVRRFSLLPKP